MNIITIGELTITVEVTARMKIRGGRELGGVEVGVIVKGGGIIGVGVEMKIEGTGEPKGIPGVLPGALQGTTTNRGDDHTILYYIKIYIIYYIMFTFLF
jgi:hypothetical protein